MTEETVFVSNEIEFSSITIKGEDLIVTGRDTIIQRLLVNQFLIIKPEVIKHEYYYTDGTLRIVPKQVFEIVEFDDHVEIRPVQ